MNVFMLMAGILNLISVIWLMNIFEGYDQATKSKVLYILFLLIVAAVIGLSVGMAN